MKTGKLCDLNEPKPIIMGNSDAGRMMGEPRGSDHRDQKPEPLQDEGQKDQAQGEQNSKAANSGDGGQSQDAAGAAGAAGSGSGQNQGQGQGSNQKQSQKDNRDEDGNRDQDGQKKRCDKCGKKLGLTGGFPCRCGGTYCSVHRYSDRHECSFDYREMGATEIRRDNPLVVASKLRKL
ncbi:hypothetical protein KR084_008816 [Drosophila pseudotakahashii]|nr:hypothetical protein KR084_008816 [Drosophila pseudotakahashii]